MSSVILYLLSDDIRVALYEAKADIDTCPLCLELWSAHCGALDFHLEFNNHFN